MLTRRVIPCLDVRDGRIVKGVRFQELRDAGDPGSASAAYETQGADEIVLLDVSATREERAAHLGTVARVREALGIPLTVGGGVRGVSDADALLNAGADKVAVNSAAVGRPDLLAELASMFGSQCVVIAIDARRRGESWEIVTHAGARATGIDAVGWAARCASLGAGEVLLTSWDRDGTRDGYDLELIREVRSVVEVPIIASGGAAGPGDFARAFEAGADAALAAGMFHDGTWGIQETKAALRSAGLEVRL